jgi:SAM-dependent methyltransferase
MLGADRYRYTQPDVWRTVHARQAAMLALLRAHDWHDLGARDVLEVGCGAGGNLLELIRMGFAPERLLGIEIDGERADAARRVLPASVRIDVGDAMAIDVPAASQDLVMQFTVFSSILDDAARAALAQRIWQWLKPGGAVLSYDFAYDSPRNSQVRRLRVDDLRRLFPDAASVRVRRVTLAPPLGRALASVHPALYAMADLLPWLRTHRLVWLTKPAHLPAPTPERSHNATQATPKTHRP